MRAQAAALCLCLAGLWASLAGCGAAHSHAAIRDAELTRAEALLERVRTHAAYEFARAEAFLLRARILAGHSDHDGAAELASSARNAYLHAVLLARDNMARKHYRPTHLDWETPVEPAQSDAERRLERLRRRR